MIFRPSFSGKTALADDPRYPVSEQTPNGCRATITPRYLFSVFFIDVLWTKIEPESLKNGLNPRSESWFFMILLCTRLHVTFCLVIGYPWTIYFFKRAWAEESKSFNDVKIGSLYAEILIQTWGIKTRFRAPSDVHHPTICAFDSWFPGQL